MGEWWRWGTSDTEDWESRRQIGDGHGLAGCEALGFEAARGTWRSARRLGLHWVAAERSLAKKPPSDGSGLLALVMSIVRGRMSCLARVCTMASSSAALQTTKTIKPLLSMSSESDLVRGSAGEPAITTTSDRPPFLARLALRVFRSDRARRNPLYTAEPQMTRMTPVKILWRTTQSWARSRRDSDTTATGAEGGRRGRAYSGSQEALDSFSRSICAARSTL